MFRGHDPSDHDQVRPIDFARCGRCHMGAIESGKAGFDAAMLHDRSSISKQYLSSRFQCRVERRDTRARFQSRVSMTVSKKGY